MTFIKSYFSFIIILFALVALQACKAKKLIQKPVPPVETVKSPPVEQVKAQPVETPAPAVVPVKKQEINVNNVKIQFEFDSSVLRTDSYPVLDEIASAMKANPAATYFLNGYASIEGTKEHNMVLSADRANAVKTYLVNEGVEVNTIKTRGLGTRNPIGDNSTEAGRVLNRRVEIKTRQ